MQAIETKFLPPTTCRGSRIRVSSQGDSAITGWDDALNPEDNHKAAAQRYARGKGWTGRWIGGARPDGKGWVFVNAHRGPEFYIAKDREVAA